jgi:hypothetical protein
LSTSLDISLFVVHEPKRKETKRNEKKRNGHDEWRLKRHKKTRLSGTKIESNDPLMDYELSKTKIQRIKTMNLQRENSKTPQHAHPMHTTRDMQENFWCSVGLREDRSEEWEDITDITITNWTATQINSLLIPTFLIDVSNMENEDVVKREKPILP